jgi:hypothetical protein
VSELAGELFPGFSAYLTGPALWAVLAGAGVFIGVMTGLFGVGGGFLAVPLMTAGLGMPYPLAIGSSLCFIVGTSSAGLPRHSRAGHVTIRAAVVLSAGSILGAVLGDVIQDALIHHAAGGDEARFTEIMHALFIVLLLCTAALVWRGRREHHTGRTFLQRLPLPPYIDLPSVGLAGLSLPGLVLLGIGAGILTGLFGVGGGVVFVPVLILLVGLGSHQAVGTSLAVVLLAAAAGTVKKALAAEVNLAVAMALLVGSSIGVQLGACLRRAFAFVVLLAALMLGVDLARRLGWGA